MVENRRAYRTGAQSLLLAVVVATAGAHCTSSPSVRGLTDAGATDSGADSGLLDAGTPDDRSDGGPPVVTSSVPPFTDTGPFVVGHVTGIVYGTAPDKTNTPVSLLMDIDYPVLTQTPMPALPTILCVHGGGWLSGDRTQCFDFDHNTNNIRADQAARGYVVASIDYRLSGQAVFPAQIEDVKGAVRYLRQNATSFTGFAIDTTRIGVFGPSAGGHLSSLLGTSTGVAAFDGTVSLGFDSSVQAVVAFFGPSDLVQMDAELAADFGPGNFAPHDAPNSPESQLLGCTLGSTSQCDATAETANPITYVTNHSPPFLLRHGGADKTVPHGQSILLHDALVDAGVYADVRILAGIGHGFENNICDGGSQCSQDARNAYEEGMRFMDRVLRGL